MERDRGMELGWCPERRGIREENRGEKDENEVGRKGSGLQLLL